MKIISFAILVLFSFDIVTAQTTDTVDTIEIKYKNCLGTGEFAFGCAVTYYYQVDSLLKQVNKKLRESLDPLQAKSIERKEEKWLIRRDRFFRKFEREYTWNTGYTIPPDNNVSGESNEIPPYVDRSGGESEKHLYESKAYFLQTRTLYLIKKLRRIKGT